MWEDYYEIPDEDAAWVDEYDDYYDYYEGGYAFL